MKNIIAIISALIVAACASQAKDQTSTIGYDKAKTCITCHGEDGIHGKENIPPIGHMTVDEMGIALTNLKDANPAVPIIAHTLTEEDVRDISGYFASAKK